MWRDTGDFCDSAKLVFKTISQGSIKGMEERQGARRVSIQLPSEEVTRVFKDGSNQELLRFDGLIVYG